MMLKRNRLSSVAGRPLLTVALLLGGTGFVTPARAATFTVLNTLDDGSDGTLRWAVGQANSTAGADTIDFDSTAFSTPQTITLLLGSGGQLTLTDTSTATISGPAAGVTISGNNTSRVFFIDSGASAVLSGFTITGGTTAGGGYGGGIFNVGTLTVTNSTISDNSASVGGGIFNFFGTLTVTNSTISDNSADNGGGIFSRGTVTVTVTNSTISGNSAANFGGGIFNFDTLIVTNCTISDNSANNEGGGIFNAGAVTVTNSTISDNSAVYYGGGIRTFGTLTVTNSTMSGNSASVGGGIFNTSTATLRNTLVSNSISGGDCFNIGVLNADTYNIDSDGSCGGATQKTSAEINLGPLSSNGGPTQTMALGAGSAAIGAGNDAYAAGLLYDQRGLGFDRISGGTVDVGAFEVQAIYDFTGFFQPVDNLPTLNQVKAGQGVPVKFSLGGDQGLDILASGSPTSVQIACDGSAPVDAVETVTAGNSGLSYDALTDTYTYVWKTNKGWAGTCRQLRVTLADVTVHVANFKLK